MPRKRRTPQYCLHRSTGRAYTRIEGRWINLGKHGTPESQGKYHRLISEWHARGQAPPDDRNAEPSGFTVNELLIRYYRFCESHYGSRRTVVKRLSVVRFQPRLAWPETPWRGPWSYQTPVGPTTRRGDLQL